MENFNKNPLFIAILTLIFGFAFTWILDSSEGIELSLGLKIFISILAAISAYRHVYTKNKKKD
ncbi:hypothetical protein Q7A53_03855 [Halobacillus rhizosphaerae]|uniref:hypothetical protein n=1 Tax=Halobacillus rhizosphaerae TaxID=3064889 RepID=UPI00398B7BCF